ncbi:MAG: multidrug efflux pump subunit AcrB [Cyclobacteriaceae bacterium]|jgi:multidrug efflux pump subunit AcrB
MRLPELAIKNHQFTIVIVILLILIGVVTFITMPRSEDPQNDMAGTAINIAYPGASPEDLEQLVIDPIEEELNELEDIKKIESSAFDGAAFIAIEFNAGADPEDKYRKVLDKMNNIEPTLPKEIVSIEKKKFSVMDVSIMQIALISESLNYPDMEDHAKRLKKSIEKSYGIRKVEILAVPEREVRIISDFERMGSYKVSINQLSRAIQSANANIPGGTIDVGSKRFSVKTSGSYESLEDIRNTIILSSGNSQVSVRDVAKVEFANVEDRYIARYNGQKAIFLSVLQKKNTNIYEIDNLLKPKMVAFESSLPENIKMETVLNQATTVRNRIGNFFINFSQGILLVGIFILIAVGIRASIVVMIAIPVSVLIGLTILDVTGFGMQQMSIAGLIIALGLLVDNSIAVVENIQRYLEMGYNNVDAAIKGTKEIGWALVSATATTVLAFLPMASVGGPTGDFIRSLALVVIYTLIASLVIALTFTPYFSSVILKFKEKKEKKSLLDSFIDNYYLKILRGSLNRPKTTIAIVAVIFLSSLSLFGLIGVTFFPKAEKAQLLVDIQTPEGSSFDKTNEVVNYVEEVLKDYDEVIKVAANVGKSNPRVYYNIFSGSYSVTHGQVYVVLKEYDGEAMISFVAELRKIFDKYPSAAIEVKEFIQGPPVEAPIAIKVMGDDLNVIKRISKDVEKIMSETEGVINVNNVLTSAKTSLKVDVDYQRAGMFGVGVSDVDMAVRTHIAGSEVGEFRDKKGETYDLKIRMPYNKTPGYEELEKVYVSNAMGNQIPLKQVADIRFEQSLKKISHYNLDRQNSITADVTDIGKAASLTQDIIEKLDNYDFPEGYTFYAGGQLEEQQESFGDMGKVLLISLIGIFAILVLQFRSFTQPLIIYSAIPLAVTGAFIALFITGHTFSFMAFIGLTSLIGIVVNDSILLVDYTNQLRKSGTEFMEAIIQAGKTRFLPIILTTVTTIGGLLPLTLRGGDMWAPMGWSIIGGLLSSTVLCLVIVPVLYKLYSKE